MEAVRRPTAVDWAEVNRRVPRLGHAFSAHGLAGTLGWALAPVFLAGIATIAGWRLALLAAAALAFAVLVALAAFRDLLDPREVQHAVAKPSSGAGGSILAFMSAPVWMCFAFFLISSFSFGGIQSFAPAVKRKRAARPKRQTVITIFRILFRIIERAMAACHSTVR